MAAMPCSRIRPWALAMRDWYSSRPIGAVRAVMFARPASACSGFLPPTPTVILFSWVMLQCAEFKYHLNRRQRYFSVPLNFNKATSLFYNAPPVILAPFRTRATPMTVDRIGERLRRYRRAANKTLNQVAAESGLTASFLSQAERNLTGVSISSLANIAKSLGIPLNTLFDQPPQHQPDSHQGQRVRYTIGGQPLAYERLSSNFPGNLINAVKMS